MAKLFKNFIPMLLAYHIGILVVFTGNVLEPFYLEKAFFRNIFGCMKNLNVAARDHMYPDIQAMPSTIEINLALYIVLVACHTMDTIETELDATKDFVYYMKHHYDLDIVFQPTNIGNGGTEQGRFFKERIPELILIDYSDKSCLLILNSVHIVGKAEMVIHSRYPALVLNIANKVQFFQ